MLNKSGSFMHWVLGQANHCCRSTESTTPPWFNYNSWGLCFYLGRTSFQSKCKIIQSNRCNSWDRIQTAELSCFIKKKKRKEIQGILYLLSSTLFLTAIKKFPFPNSITVCNSIQNWIESKKMERLLAIFLLPKAVFQDTVWCTFIRLINSSIIFFLYPSWASSPFCLTGNS